jgi:hypothetical protein
LAGLTAEADKGNGTGIVHLSAPFALGDLMPQVGQRNVGTKLHDQILFPVLVCVLKT